MPQDRFMIAPLNTGLVTDLTSWLIPDDAFARLKNAYVYKGRVRKRFGSRSMARDEDSNVAQLASRLRVQVNTTSGGAISGTIPAELFTNAKIGQLFSIDDVIFTITVPGIPGTMLKTGSATTATFDTSTGDYVFTGVATAAAVYFYPALPVMGLPTYELTTKNEEQIIAFDTRYAYEYAGNAWQRLGAPTTTTKWTGDNKDFFWATNYRGLDSDDYILFVSNYVAVDGIRYWNKSEWADLTPIVSATNRMRTARIILPFKDRLVALNTIENGEGTLAGTTAATTGNLTATIGTATTDIGQQFLVGSTVFTVASDTPGAQAMTVTTFTTGTPSTGTFNVTTKQVIITGNNQNPSTQVFFFLVSGGVGNLQTFRNRARLSQNGSPIDENSWVEAPGRGLFLDAPTKEAIVTAEFIKDRLIVYFERSTWELAYTGNSILPVRWQKINTELGAEGTFSVVPFDKVVLGVGNVGIHGCTGANVDRIDDKIDQEVFAISNADDGPQRVHGIRDYEVEQVYWTFPSITQEDQSQEQESAITFPYPDKVLVYNYETGAWGINDDSITAFGYYQDDQSETWQSTELTWEEWGASWDEGTLQSRFRNIIAGNQQGYIFILGVDIHRNAPALQITAVNPATKEVTVIDHNLKVGDYIALENMGGLALARPTDSSSTDNVIYLVDSVTSTRIIPRDISFTGTYTGGGTIARMSEMDILTKEYNFYLKEGMNVSVSHVDFHVDKTENGSLTIDYFASSSSISLIDAGASTGSLLGTTVLETSPYSTVPLEQTQKRLWHPVYMQLDGEFIQLQLKPRFSEMIDFDNATSDFQLHAMIFHAQPTSSRLQ